MFCGMFSAVGVRWVDEPFDVERAELKLLQLSIASGLGLATPPTQVTNDTSVAREFASGRRIVAKPLSPGVGIAPFVAEVAEAELEKVASMPTLLQGLIEASADLRVVVVNGEAWAWRRSRGGATIDWRAEDPTGAGFQYVECQEVCRLALQMTSALRLTMTVQDWLETKDGPVFLEANPQGAWLFLPEARAIVAPALAQHLLYGRRDSPGTWPRAIKRFLWDFLPNEKAPPNDGVVAPEFAKPDWVDEVSATSEALDTARRAHDDAKAGAKTAEDKANRLVQTALALLTIALALGAFQMKLVLDRSWPWMFSLAPVCAAVVFLAFAAFEALEIDRVGVYRLPTAGDLAGSGQGHPRAVLIAEEERGRRLARWTSAHKHTDLMQARAWFSRGLAALLLAALIAAIARAVVADPPFP
jgi:hypothetical protein